ncbi:putative RNA methyltransferase CG11342 isoform X2 [Lycorma delicatula]|uniref:putative RNA methyltransferase CG11342 isoform X2 n=1 Tax=Lycorma delicatula TaxID=130591 RepID=UPI003F5134EB
MNNLKEVVDVVRFGSFYFNRLRSGNLIFKLVHFQNMFNVNITVGVLTEALFDYLINSSQVYSNRKQSFVIIAVDVDQTLIERAKESNYNINIIYLCLDIMNENAKEVLNYYLKKHNKSSFDISFSFSISMWIHLNHGDEGLKMFLKTISEYSDTVILEPQPWKCYRNAVRRLRKCNAGQFLFFDYLLIRQSVEADISDFIQKVCNCEKVFETGETKWGRKITVYKTNTQ